MPCPVCGRYFSGAEWDGRSIPPPGTQSLWPKEYRTLFAGLKGDEWHKGIGYCGVGICEAKARLIKQDWIVKQEAMEKP